MTDCELDNLYEPIIYLLKGSFFIPAHSINDPINKMKNDIIMAGISGRLLRMPQLNMILRKSMCDRYIPNVRDEI